ncbi:pirin family protein [Thorsellia anophelis]|uniref:Pirin N-terminal domain-containing protein n=1 Tax=Thorsellia anophelis DSM 18579 TaxID=1123402 RepID=A0A1I0E804_9GAMM|nr:pirin-like bicupin family protein [Thorsellia anophelis]SET40555.1 hypothetical protein SAMN02583745_02266 [Thorsellia anophelis DSM 18579]
MISIRRSQDRGKSDLGWLQSYFSFSFADYYDSRHMNFSALRVINEDFIAPDSGFGMHPHKNMEILTYILSGSITHEDSMGNQRTLSAGEFQIMSAGTGIYHSEFNASKTDPLHMYQIWVMPNQMNITPRYDERFLPKSIGKQLILAPTPTENAFIINQDMTLTRQIEVANTKETIEITDNRALYIQVVSGKIRGNTIEAQAGDALLVDKEYLLTIEFLVESEILIFNLPSN